MDFVLFLFTNLIDFVILDQYYCCFTKERKRNHYITLAALLSFDFVLSIVNVIGHPTLNLACSVILIYLYGTNFILAFRYYFILPVFYLGIGFITEPIGILILGSITGLFPRLSSQIVYCMTVMVSEFIRLLIVVIIKCYWKAQLMNLPVKQYLLLCMVPIIGIISCCIIIRAIWLYNTLEGELLCIGIVFLVLFSNILVFTVFQKMNNMFMKMHQNEMVIQEAKLKEEYYREVDKSSRQLRKIRHDLKNRLAGIYSIKGNEELIRKEIKKILGELEESNQNIYTINCVLNSVLNIKYKAACKEKIRIENNILVPKYMNIDYGDMGVLFGNLLDNAIEACRNVPEGARWIEVTVNYSEHILVIKMRNSKSPKSIEKADHINHGIGLKSVKQIIEKYHGVTEFEDLGEIFEYSAILYGIQDDRDMIKVQ